VTGSFTIVFTANAAIRFLLEMGSCALLVVIGFKGYRPPLNLLIGIALPLVVMGVWAYFVAPLSAHRGFFGNRHFSRANDYLVALGESPIDW